MAMLNRRDLLKTAASGAALLAVPSLPILAQDKKSEGFTLPKLPYAFDALEPHIDAMTMEIHHDRHHKAYVDNLNKLVAGTEWASKSVEEIVKNLDKVPEKARIGVRNNAGGHYNHSLFWQMMSKKGGEPKGALKEAITASFGDVAGMLKTLKESGVARFGSGWAWVLATKEGKLKVASTPNQDNSLMDASGVPVLGVDVWEHAYYLKYQNKRPDYIENWFKVINWEWVTEHYEAVKKAL
jgi:superoxide dismutase, Fe-Mn family